MIDLTAIKNPRKSKPTKTNDEFEPLSIYLNLSRRCINYFTTKHCSYLRNIMLNSDDIVGNVATAIMMADWTWEEKRCNNTTKSAYRYQKVYWVLKKIIHNYFNCKDVQPNNYHFTFIQNKTPLDHIIKQETIEELLQSQLLTTRERQYVHMYHVDNLTFQAIGAKFGITKSAVEYTYKKAIRKLRKHYQDEIHS